MHHVFARHLLDGQHRVAEPLKDIDQLPDGGDVVKDDVVRKEDGERLVSDDIPSDRYSMAVAKTLLLVDVDY